MQLQSMLQTYESMSGQAINKDKLAIMFSSNTRVVWRAEVKSVLRIEKETMTDHYLGLPVRVGTWEWTSSNVHVPYLLQKERMWLRVHG